jgi:hypothetical protein
LQRLDTDFVLIDCFEPHEQFFSYLATVTITGKKRLQLRLLVVMVLLPKRNISLPHA